MGMYTDFCFDVALKSDTPPKVVTMLNRMRDGIHTSDDLLPQHPFFACDRWPLIGHCSSAYFDAQPRFIFEKTSYSNDYVLNIRCNLKNYGDEIEHFIDWIKPYIDASPGDFLGFHRYEKEREPTLIYM